MRSPACHSQLRAVCVKEQSDKVHRMKFCWLLSLDKGAITDSTYFMYNTPDAKSIQASGLFKCIWWYLEKPVNTSRLDAGCSVWWITSGEAIVACSPCLNLPASQGQRGGRRTVSFIRSWWSSLALQGAGRPQEEQDGHSLSAKTPSTSTAVRVETFSQCASIYQSALNISESLIGTWDRYVPLPTPAA